MLLMPQPQKRELRRSILITTISEEETCGRELVLEKEALLFYGIQVPKSVQSLLLYERGLLCLRKWVTDYDYSSQKRVAENSSGEGSVFALWYSGTQSVWSCCSAKIIAFLEKIGY
ncbi:hypothetical protein CEXT_75961 [Caerostris extrusa]|uniref:Uncharacterized protein n=1 Tax=Caerostris extrusa TaxID=172846 RepID=A0AAV4W1K0_CAEEX|nr:hypothetical protein CEXT_75961 [Caerostris extrusa]